MHGNLTGFKDRKLNLKEIQTTEGVGAIKYIHFSIIQQEYYTRSPMHLAFQFIKHCYDFVKSTFLSRASRVLDGEPKDHKRNKEKFTTHRLWRKYTPCLEGPPRKVKAGYRQKEWGTGAPAFIRVYGWSALGFLFGVRWIVQLDHKEQEFW